FPGRRDVLKCTAHARGSATNADNKAVVREEAQHHVTGAGHRERAFKYSLEGKQSIVARLQPIALRNDRPREVSVEIGGNVDERTRVHADAGIVAWNCTRGGVEVDRRERLCKSRRGRRRSVE